MNRLGRESRRLAWRLVEPSARIALSVLLLAGGAVGATAGPAAASTADGTLTVEVLRDFFGTGVINAAMDVPQRGMKVKISDPAGHDVTGVTDATGKVVVSASTVLSGGQYRVDVSVPAPYSGYLRAAPASTAENHFNSFTSFVDVSDGKNASVVTGVWDPADYTLPDSRYFVPVHNGANGTDTRALVAFGTKARGTCPADVSCPDTLATQAQVGTTFGLAYDKHRTRLFQSAFARRYAPYGPQGGGRDLHGAGQRLGRAGAVRAGTGRRGDAARHHQRDQGSRVHRRAGQGEHRWPGPVGGRLHAVRGEPADPQPGELRRDRRHRRGTQADGPDPGPGVREPRRLAAVRSADPQQHAVRRRRVQRGEHTAAR